MASSRAPRSKVDADSALLTVVRSAIEEAQRRAAKGIAVPDSALQAPARKKAPAPIVVALSGGRDSVALLDLVARLRAQRGSGVREVVAVHIHHGLSAHADAWQAHCEALCERLNVPLEVRAVEVKRKGRGIEAAAREARYQALAEAAVEIGAFLVLTAHHVDDQLETFLIQWMRGAGIEGLAGFPPARSFSDGSLQLVRPFARTSRAELERHLQLHGLSYVDDDSNEDTSLLRNAVRLGVLPVMDSARPGFRAAAARSIELVGEAAEVLRDVAREDLEACREGEAPGMLRLDRLAGLPDARRALVLRAWLDSAGLEAPSRARLTELLRQALHAKSDAKLLVRLGVYELRRHRGLLLLRASDTATHAGQSFDWRGEDEISLAAWGGALRFVSTSGEGFGADWLRAMPLEIRARGGGERFKPHPTRPSKTLKRLFQDADIAEFERAQLPLLWRDGRLIFVAGLGADVRLTVDDGERVRIEWRGDDGLIDR